jgi:hypothetical protein
MQTKGAVFTPDLPGHDMFQEATGVFITIPLRGELHLEEISVNGARISKE